MNKILLEVLGLSHSLSLNDAFALILADKKSNLKLPIIIGSTEAQSIALALDEYESRRPLTHDLFKNFADNYNINVKEVVINRFREGVFFSQLVCEKDGETSIFDARTSDSVALALRFKCPIYTIQQVLDEAGVEIDQNQNLDQNPDQNGDSYDNDDDWLETRSVRELKDLMANAVDDEDYERASKIRDLIKLKENQ